MSSSSVAAPAATARAPAAPAGALTTARRMIGADFLKVSRRAATVGWALVLAFVPLIIYFLVAALQHSSNPVNNPPAGGVRGYGDVMRILTLFVGPLAAVMVGVQAGVGDSAAGVFRDLVVTGRSRLALFASRVPAGLLVALPIITLAYGLSVAGVFIFASGDPTPSASAIGWGYGYALLADGMLCVIAVGIAALLDSRPAAITTLVGWQLVVSPVLVRVSSLGSFRESFLDAPMANIDPAPVPDRFHVPMSTGAIVLTIVLWAVVPLALGAWRTARLEA
jgi:hypothetical protein